MSYQEQESIILLVEDDEINAEALALIVSSETSYQPFAVPSGEEAIRAAQEMMPALLLIDYNLPGMDGVQTYEQIQAIPGLETVPAIFLSATDHLDVLRERHLTAIEKPYELEELLTLIQTHIKTNNPSLENGPLPTVPLNEPTLLEE